jgi:hypothetical protein
MRKNAAPGAHAAVAGAGLENVIEDFSPFFVTALERAD